MAASPNAAELAGGNYLAELSVMLQDVNGDAVFSNERALYGFVAAHEHLILPQVFTNAAGTKIRVGTSDREFPDIELSEFGSRDHIKTKLGAGGQAYRDGHLYTYYTEALTFTKIALMNYWTLVTGGYDPRTAYVISSLRARWCMLGAYNVSSLDTSRPYNEVTIRGVNGQNGVDTSAGDRGDVSDQIAMAADLAAVFNVDLNLSRQYMSFNKDPKIGSRWITKVAETIWAATEYVVRVRGHHYKPEYEDLLKKFVTACFEGEDVLPSDIDLAAIFRISIHAFGLKALPVMTAHFAIFGKLGNAALIRFSGAPNGMAVVTTTAAALRAMASEPWYGKFKATYKGQIDLLENMENHVISNKFGFHMSARLYGVATVTAVTVGGKDYSVEQVKDVGANMASIGQGFIEAMNAAKASNSITAFSFSKAKSLEKFAGNAPLTVLRIKTLILFAIDSITEAREMTKAIEAAIPETREASSSTAVTSTTTTTSP